MQTYFTFVELMVLECPLLHHLHSWYFLAVLIVQSITSQTLILLDRVAVKSAECIIGFLNSAKTVCCRTG
jgi:hypothetical protein